MSFFYSQNFWKRKLLQEISAFFKKCLVRVHGVVRIRAAARGRARHRALGLGLTAEADRDPDLFLVTKMAMTPHSR